jgi:hypothetical protein
VKPEGLPAPRHELAALAVLDPTAASPPYARRLNRPLGVFSDFVCERLGPLNEKVRTGDLSATDLFRTIDGLSTAVSTEAIGEVHEVSNSDGRRTALLDLAFAERSLNVAFHDTSDYRGARNASDFFAKAVSLAAVEGRHPILSWSDIAIHHPVEDPRSFLDHGAARDQEVFMYRVQGAIERAFKTIASDWLHEVMSAEWLAEVKADLDAVVSAMAHLTRVREIGQFYKLDPFLSLNNEVRGHGTGAFSAWTFVAGFALTGRSEFRSRLCDEANLMAFDPDAVPYIDLIAANEMGTLADSARKCGLDRGLTAAEDRFIDFLKIHRSAIRKHAPGSFTDAAPANPTITNEESIRAAIGGAHSFAG